MIALQFVLYVIVPMYVALGLFPRFVNWLCAHFAEGKDEHGLSDLYESDETL